MAEIAKSWGEDVAKLIDKLAGKGSDLELNTRGRWIQSQTERVYCVKYSLRFRKEVSRTHLCSLGCNLGNTDAASSRS